MAEAQEGIVWLCRRLAHNAELQSQDYVMTLGDTLDLVPVAGWHGNGRKAQWWSPVLLALRDPDTGVFVAVCKCMSGGGSSSRLLGG